MPTSDLPDTDPWSQAQHARIIKLVREAADAAPDIVEQERHKRTVLKAIRMLNEPRIDRAKALLEGLL
jgi:hypothetical protein